ncbi:DUF2318 domain-containing protein [Treponema zuelzerae]|uniref:DUF2318 domain-containing protein n=1 Tax=Teretinema zuelzerae TaxID=156 RepID=A0AAE3EKJ9_9SPIR|nr:DUF2318 domain-containing protein [Teretinema zuelzerae]MCD1655189.1 DUF2318 domain-containing protein [Teretinema zuelzerae]
MSNKNNARCIGVLFSAFALAFSVQTAFAETSTKKAADWGVVIDKKKVTNVAAFIPYTANGTKMELIAIRASDGTIRTALNTCQVCYNSGRGFYKQEGDVFVCQNCGNRFKADQIEKIKGGCNPVPILSSDKTDLGDTIGISKSYLESVTPYFARWKK